MEYVPGIIHEKYQQIHAIQVNRPNFNFLVLKDGIRYSDCDVQDETQMETIPLKANDIFLVRFFKPNEFSGVKSMVFFVGYNETILNRESIMSKEFIEVNLTDRKINGIFTDVTHQFVRNEKLNQILN